MINKLRQILPKSFRTKLREAYYSGNRFICPICNKSARKFKAFGDPPTPNRACPYCGSIERYRLMWHYMENETNIMTAKLKVLHFAPEVCIQNRIEVLPDIEYISADLYAPRAMMKEDITDMTFEDDTFDVILCSHILEHVSDDNKALVEMRRVLKPDGWAIIQVPYQKDRKTTYEDSSITNPAERFKAFGQDDHVRIYGCDYPERFENAGWNLKINQYRDQIDEDLLEKYRMKDDIGEINFCTL